MFPDDVHGALGGKFVHLRRFHPTEHMLVRFKDLCGGRAVGLLEPRRRIVLLLRRPDLSDVVVRSAGTHHRPCHRSGGKAIGLGVVDQRGNADVPAEPVPVRTALRAGLKPLIVLVELMTVGLTSIWFAAGSFVAFIIALLGGNVVVQGIAFILVSVVLLALTKPWAGKYINSRTVKTNVDSLVGERAVLTEDADSMKQTGKAVVNGQEWTVRPQDETQVIRKGELIEVVKISGVKLIVKRVKEA